MRFSMTCFYINIKLNIQIKANFEENLAFGGIRVNRSALLIFVKISLNNSKILIYFLQFQIRFGKLFFTLKCY